MDYTPLLNSLKDLLILLAPVVYAWFLKECLPEILDLVTQWWSSRPQARRELYTRLLQSVVYATEQYCRDRTGNQKMAYALEMMDRKLALAGLAVDPGVLRSDLEAQVYLQLNKDKRVLRG